MQHVCAIVARGALTLGMVSGLPEVRTSRDPQRRDPRRNPPRWLAVRQDDRKGVFVELNADD
jgi:hypothetical protein